MKLFKKILFSGLALLMCVSVAACSGGKKSHSGKKEYRIGVLSIDDSFPFYVASKMGYFKKAGVDVEIIPFKSSSEESQAMEAGEIDMMMNDMIVQSLLQKSKTKTRIVATAYGAKPEEGRFVVASSPKSGIKKPEDFYGKKIAISNNTMMEYLIDSYFSDLGLDIKKVELVNIPNLGTRLETLLAGKDIDGAILPDPLASIASVNGAETVIDDTKMGKNFSQSVIIASDKAVTEKKEDTQKVLDSIFKAMDEINKDPGKFTDMERTFSRIPKPLKDKHPMPHYTAGVIPSENEFESVQNWMVKKGLLHSSFSYDELVDPEFLKYRNEDK